jgi:hypothetical protein
MFVEIRVNIWLPRTPLFLNLINFVITQYTHTIIILADRAIYNFCDRITRDGGRDIPIYIIFNGNSIQYHTHTHTHTKYNNGRV